jgi:hypothetical protein
LFLYVRINNSLRHFHLTNCWVWLRTVVVQRMVAELAVRIVALVGSYPDLP